MEEKLATYKCWNSNTVNNILPFFSETAAHEAYVAETKDDFQIFSVFTEFKAIRKIKWDENLTTDMGPSSLSEILNNFNKESIQFIGITGESGAGKTHLVEVLTRIYEIEQKKFKKHNDEVMVKLSRNNLNLHDFLKRLIQELPKNLQEKYVKDLKNLKDQFTTELGQVKNNFLDLLINNCEANIDEVSEEGISSTKKNKVIKDRDDIKDSFRDYLQQTATRKYFTKEGSSIDKYIKELTNGGGVLEDKDFKFTTDDIQILEDIDFAKLSPSSIEFLGKIRFDNSPIPKVCVDWLNENIERTTKQLYLTDLNIFDIFLEIRKEIAKQGKKILLVIQDLSTIQNKGLNDILNAIIEDSTKENKLAKIRVLAAGTQQPFIKHFKETIRTRLSSGGGFLYSLDNLEGETETNQDIEFYKEFVANNLRVFRNDFKEVENNFNNLIKSKKVDEFLNPNIWVNNTCNSCKFKTECHEQFGKVELQNNNSEIEDVGLYPFTNKFIERLVLIRQNKLTPRKIQQDLFTGTFQSEFTEIGFDVLEELGNKGFPNKNWREFVHKDKNYDKDIVNSFSNIDIQNIKEKHPSFGENLYISIEEFANENKFDNFSFLTALGFEDAIDTKELVSINESSDDLSNVTLKSEIESNPKKLKGQNMINSINAWDGKSKLDPKIQNVISENLVRYVLQYFSEKDLLNGFNRKRSANSLSFIRPRDVIIFKPDKIKLDKFQIEITENDKSLLESIFKIFYFEEDISFHTLNIEKNLSKKYDLYNKFVSNQEELNDETPIKYSLYKLIYFLNKYELIEPDDLINLDVYLFKNLHENLEHFETLLDISQLKSLLKLLTDLEYFFKTPDGSLDIESVKDFRLIYNVVSSENEKNHLEKLFGKKFDQKNINLEYKLKGNLKVKVLEKRLEKYDLEFEKEIDKKIKTINDELSSFNGLEELDIVDFLEVSIEVLKYLSKNYSSDFDSLLDAFDKFYEIFSNDDIYSNMFQMLNEDIKKLDKFELFKKYKTNIFINSKNNELKILEFLKNLRYLSNNIENYSLSNKTTNSSVEFNEILENINQNLVNAKNQILTNLDSY